MMTLQASRTVRFLVPLALLGVAVGTAAPSHGLARAQSLGDVARHTSAAYGYTLRIPTGWTRVPGVRWTPAGPPADLTLMTPDHQAALGVIVSPTGSRRYSEAELRTVALRLLYQQNGVIPVSPIQQKRVVVNGVPFETALSFTFSGVGIYTYSSTTLVGVWVTQRYNRLYALPAVVYVHQGAQPPPRPGEPTPTDTPEGQYRVAPDGEREQGYQEGAAAPAPLPTAGPAATAQQLVQGPAGPPRPLPTDHLRGNPCPDASDRALIIRDKNCAYNVEARALTAMHTSFSFTAQVTPDGRPEAPVGVDGFAVATDSALGVRLEYPAHWKAVSAPNTNAALQSADRNTLVTLQTQRTDAETLGTSDLQSIADSQISQVASGPPPTYQTVRANGVLYLRALAAHAIITPPGGGVGNLQAQVSVTVASYHHRLYSLRAVALTYLASLDVNAAPPAVYPYFTPFTTLARLTQSTVDLLLQQSNLAMQTTLSLYIDPRVPEA